MKLPSPELGIFLLRVALGVVFIAHALLKPTVLGWTEAAAFFARYGFPGWSVYPVFAIELVAGLLMLIGLGARWAALLLVPVVLGALRVYVGNGWVFSRPGGGWEYIAFLVAALLALAAGGNGAFSLQIALRSARSRQTAK